MEYKVKCEEGGLQERPIQTLLFGGVVLTIT